MKMEFREALRSIWSDRSVSVIVVLTLALAVAANTLMFSVVYGVLLRPLAYPEPDRLVLLWENNLERGLDQTRVSAATYLDWRKAATSLSDIAAFRYLGHTYDREGEPERISTVEVSPRLFRLLGVRPHLGRLLREEDEKPGNEQFVLLSYASWVRRLGGQPQILNSTIRLDGRPHTVVGVMPEGFVFPPSSPEVELWLPLTLDLESLQSRPHRMYNAIGRLADGATPQQAREEMSIIAKRIAEANPTSNKGWGVTLRPVMEYLVGDLSSTLWLLLAAVGLVMLIACTNLANLLLAKSVRVQKDYAIRAAVGASTFDLLRRSLLENILVALLGGATGLIAAMALFPWILQLLPRSVPRLDEIRMDTTALLFTVGITAGAGLLIGLAPAIRAMRCNLAGMLQEVGRSAHLGRRGRLFSRTLVVCEVLFAFLLLIGATLLVRSFLSLMEVDPGFRKDGFVSIALSLPRARYPGFEQERRFVEELETAVNALPGVLEAGVVNALPMSSLGSEFDMPFSYQGLEVASPSERPTAKYRAATGKYLQAVGIPLISGRGFDSFDRGDGRKVILINQLMAEKYFLDRDPVGETLKMPMVGEAEVIGIVGNVRHYGLEAPVQPEVFVPFDQLPLRDLHVVVHSRNQAPERVVREVRALLGRIDSELPITDVLTPRRLLSESVAARRLNMAVMLGLALIAAVMAALGIYGVVSYLVAQREGEIGLRIAMGARSKDIAWLILRQTLILVGGAILLGAAAARLGGKLLQQQLFGVTTADPITYILVSLGILLLGVLASAVPALRAAAVDPAEALRAN
ncbi:MAG: ABC transporter permease [Acidobacteriota bacterium]